LRAFRPDVVLSTGGFVSVPSVVAARGIAPVVTHEQTATIGLANRVNARFADVLAVSFAQTEPTARALHRSVLVTGNPVRSELLTGDRARGLHRFGFDPGTPVLYVTGGARGSTPINQRIAQILPDILEQTQIIHQTGALGANADASTQQAQRDTMPERLARRYQIVDLVREELPDVYAASDLVIGRAGAGTVAELAYVGLPAIFIPLPGAGGDEQTMNARVLASAGAAVIIPQHEATPERLRAEIERLLSDRHERSRMAQAARSVARPDAADRLADALTALASGEPLNSR
jgi:UDP-N-acetylglucosamine--N-acetylmuramyl-(pentapeptide) pyrophosphoryl-undecaprenol N-acetylglucosamine transferase